MKMIKFEINIYQADLLHQALIRHRSTIDEVLRGLTAELFPQPVSIAPKSEGIPDLEAAS